MKLDQHLTCEGWDDYELLDSGENMKLERFGEVIVARPETQALWAKARPELWKDAHAVFTFGDKKGSWDVKKPLPEPWQLAWRLPAQAGTARFTAALTGFKHTGIFPEQSPNWAWLCDRVCMWDVARPISNVGRATSHMQGPKVLNLFGYTGIATSVAALAATTAAGGSPDGSENEPSRGAHVTHVDASKQSLDWAHDNARKSGVGEDKIRWILDDALAFVKRETRRGVKYDGIILDPPAFGRGAKGEVWHIEEDLPTLLAHLREILSDQAGSFFLLNGYAAGYAPRSFAQAIESTFNLAVQPPSESECGELHIKESSSPRVIPAGIYVRFVR